MARTGIAKSSAIDEAVLDAAARLRGRILALMHGAAEKSGCTQQMIADALGVRRGAVNQVFNGRGNITVNTFAEYLGAMGLEADVVLVPLGEISTAMRERRQPEWVAVTRSDSDRVTIHAQRLHILSVSSGDWSVRTREEDPPRHLVAHRSRIIASGQSASEVPEPLKVVTNWRS